MMDDAFFPDAPPASNALPATKTAGGMRITQKKNRRTGADQTPAVLPNEKLADEMPQVEEALEERALPAAREHNKALQKMQHEREPTVQKMPKNDNRQTRAEGRIGQPRPGF
mmetsp:Transcript_60677/g.142895  ORF Transcript_60677/g.142895 Transcript_60677/m.142895 type:complete len:112 (+) Transcript_60677:108-443(+)